MLDFKCDIVSGSRNLSSLVRVNLFGSISSQWRKVVTSLRTGWTGDASLGVSVLCRENQGDPLRQVSKLLGRSCLTK